jgi:GTPase SAR1 family protein
MVVLGTVASRIRPMLVSSWFPSCDALIFIIDVTDRANMAEAATQLRLLSEEPTLAGKPLLLLLNKCDADDAMLTTEVFAHLQLASYNTWGLNRQWFVQRASTLTGDGVGEALDWVRREVEIARGINRQQCATFGGLQALFRPRSLFAEFH